MWSRRPCVIYLSVSISSSHESPQSDCTVLSIPWSPALHFLQPGPLPRCFLPWEPPSLSPCPPPKPQLSVTFCQKSSLVLSPVSLFSGTVFSSFGVLNLYMLYLLVWFCEQCMSTPLDFKLHPLCLPTFMSLPARTIPGTCVKIHSTVIIFFHPSCDNGRVVPPATWGKSFSCALPAGWWASPLPPPRGCFLLRLPAALQLLSAPLCARLLVISMSSLPVTPGLTPGFLHLPLLHLILCLPYYQSHLPVNSWNCSQ